MYALARACVCDAECAFVRGGREICTDVDVRKNAPLYPIKSGGDAYTVVHQTVFYITTWERICRILRMLHRYHSAKGTG